MRKEKALITILNGLVKLLSEEAARNTDFANRLDVVLAPHQGPKATPPTAVTKPGKLELPDIHA